MSYPLEHLSEAGFLYVLFVTFGLPGLLILGSAVSSLTSKNAWPVLSALCLAGILVVGEMFFLSDLDVFQENFVRNLEQEAAENKALWEASLPYVSVACELDPGASVRALPVSAADPWLPRWPSGAPVDFSGGARRAPVADAASVLDACARACSTGWMREFGPGVCTCK